MFNRLRQEDGIGIITALSVSFVVFSLGAIWYSLALHELDEVSYDRNRTQSVNSAEAGAKEAMAWLAKDENSFRTLADLNGAVTTGITTGSCDVATLVSPTGDAVGEYWVRVENTGPLQYQIDSWSWVPNRESLRSVEKKISLEVELIPLGGFKDALFAAGGGIIGSNFKVIYGTGYSASDLTLGNFTRIYANDGGYDGDGSLTVYGDVVISSGSNVEIEGEVHVQGAVRDLSPGTEYFADVVIRNDPDGSLGSAYGDNYFEKSTVHNELKMFATLDPTSDVTTVGAGAAIIENALDLQFDPVPELDLPTFTYAVGNYSGYTIYPPKADLAEMQAWINANKTNLHGVHVVNSGDGSNLDFKSTIFTDHMVVIVDGSYGVKGKITGGSTPSGDPVTAVLVMRDDTGFLNLGQNLQSVPEEVHHVIYSAGQITSSNSTTIYGVVYGFEDATTNRLEIHFRPPEETVLGGFTFDPAIADEFIPEPGIWRDLPANQPFPITDYCAP